MIALLLSGVLSLTGGGGATVPLSGSVAVIASVSVSASSTTPGAPVTVTVADGPGNPTDWIGLYATGESGPRTWAYFNGTTTPPANGSTSAVVTFTMPGPGSYTFRLFRNNLYQLVATSPTVTVTAPVLPVLQVDPPSLDFGTVAPGATAERTLTLTNAGGGILAGQASVAGPDYGVFSDPTYALESGESKALPVRYTAAGQIPDVFIIAGQSNAVGYGLNLYAFTRGGKLGWKMHRTNHSAWLPLDDPVDPAGHGSPWPLVGSEYLRTRGRDVYFIPCAVGSTSIGEWQPGGQLYAALKARAGRVGPRRLAGVLWWQGETDAAWGTSRDAYAGSLRTLAAAVRADLGAPMIVAKIQTTSGATEAIAVINSAIGDVWASGEVKRGPDLSDIESDEGSHLGSDANIRLAAARWWAAIAAVHGWTP